LFIVPERAMARLSDLETPPGVLSVFSTALAGLDTLLAAGDAVVLLAGVSDPGNAGTLLRSAEIFGVTRAVFARDGVEPHNSKVVRATMGALFRMSLALAEPDELLAAAGRNGYTIVAAMREGIALPAFRFPSRPLIAIGNERRGVGGWLPRWDAAVSIPQQGNAESLNAAVAGGILLYAFSQRSEAIHERPKSPENA
jgi:TrmH family RNA methyltransferase